MFRGGFKGIPFLTRLVVVPGMAGDGADVAAEGDLLRHGGGGGASAAGREGGGMSQEMDSDSE